MIGFLSVSLLNVHIDFNKLTVFFLLLLFLCISSSLIIVSQMKMLTEPLWSPLQILVSCRVGWPRRHCYPELQTIRLAILLLKNVQIAILHCLCCLLRNSLFVCTTGCYSKSNVCIGWHLLWLPFGRCETQAEWPTVMQKYLSLVLYPLPWTV